MSEAVDHGEADIASPAPEQAGGEGWHVHAITAVLVVLTVIAGVAAIVLTLGSLWFFHLWMTPDHRREGWIADRRSALLMSLVWASIHGLGWLWSLRWGTRRQRTLFIILTAFAATSAAPAALSAPGSGTGPLAMAHT